MVQTGRPRKTRTTKPVPTRRRRAKTINRKRLTREEMIQAAELADAMDYERPQTREECENGVRPCPFVSCRYHLYLDVNPRTGSIKLNFPDMEVWEMPYTCALDVAAEGGITLEKAGEILNLTRERIRQMEMSGLDKIRDSGFGKDLAKAMDRGPER
jgi:hypothetical protein